MDLEWMRLAHCRGQDPATFFPSDSLGVDVARRICHPCVVRRECLAYAIAEHLVHGVFGGCSERQRERMRRELETAGSPAFGPATARRTRVEEAAPSKDGAAR